MDQHVGILLNFDNSHRVHPCAGDEINTITTAPPPVIVIKQNHKKCLNILNFALSNLLELLHNLYSEHTHWATPS